MKRVAERPRIGRASDDALEVGLAYLIGAGLVLVAIAVAVSVLR